MLFNLFSICKILILNMSKCNFICQAVLFSVKIWTPDFLYKVYFLLVKKPTKNH